MSIMYKGVEIEKEDYFEVSNSLAGLKKSVCKHCGIEAKDMRWHHVVEYLNETKQVIFINHDFSVDFFGGKTQKSDDNILITLNTNDSIINGRKHFTAMHEVTHAFLHIDQSTSPLYLRDVNTLSKDYKEVQADLGASELMLPREALIAACAKNKSFYDMCYVFDCSYGALYLRLLNYLVFELRLKKGVALQLLSAYKKGWDLGVCWIIGHLKDIVDAFDHYVFLNDCPDDYQNFIKFIRNYDSVYDDCSGLALRTLHGYYAIKYKD